MSNPPPSPVGDDHREGSPDFEPQNVHVNVTSPEKGKFVHFLSRRTSELTNILFLHCLPALVDPKDLIEVEPESSAPRPLQPSGPPQLQSYDDDYLEMTCDDMDLF